MLRNSCLHSWCKIFLCGLLSDGILAMNLPQTTTAPEGAVAIEYVSVAYFTIWIVVALTLPFCFTTTV